MSKKQIPVCEVCKVQHIIDDPSFHNRKVLAQPITPVLDELDELFDRVFRDNRYLLTDVPEIGELRSALQTLIADRGRLVDNLARIDELEVIEANMISSDGQWDRIGDRIAALKASNKTDRENTAEIKILQRLSDSLPLELELLASNMSEDETQAYDAGYKMAYQEINNTIEDTISGLKASNPDTDVGEAVW